MSYDIKIRIIIVLACVVSIGAIFLVNDMPIGVSSSNPVENFNELDIGQNPYVDTVDYLKVGPMYFYRIKEFNVPEIDIEVKDMDEVIQIMSEFVYSELQSNPEELISTGYGNCQSMTIYASALLDSIDIRNEIVVTPDHMFNRVHTGEEVVDIDFANGTIN